LRLTLELVLHYRITSFKHYRIAIRRAPIGSGYSLHSARPMSVQASHSVVFLNVSPRYTSLHTLLFTKNLLYSPILIIKGNWTLRTCLKT